MEENKLDFKDRIIVKYMNLLTQQTHNVQMLQTRIEMLEEEIATLNQKGKKMEPMKKEISQEIIDEFLDLAVKHELTMADIDQISYKLREYFLRNAILKEEKIEGK